MIKNNQLLVIIFTTLISFNLYAHGIDYVHTTSHKHGVADVAIEWQNTDLVVTAVFSAQDVVGFEHIPKNAKEKRIVRDAYQKFVDNPVITAKGCYPQEVKVNSALFDEHAEGEEAGFFSGLLGNGEEPENLEVPDHMDFEAIYRFSCDMAKKPLKFTSFPVFPSLKQARVRQGAMSNEPSQTLDPKQLVINTTMEQ